MGSRRKSKQGTVAAEVPAGVSVEAFEALCNRCGKCCYQKVIIGRTVVITPFPCRFLDIQKRVCTVYDERKQKNPRCLGVVQGLRVSAFPEDCPYVKKYAPPGYRPAVDSWSWDGQWHDFDDLADDLDVPEHIREAIRALGPEAKLPWEEREVTSAGCSCREENKGT